jgi:general secretion pathway protein H
MLTSSASVPTALRAAKAMTPTSVRGLTEFRVMRRLQTGFTLIEIMVVMVIIGLTMAFVSVNFNRDDSKLLTEEANRLAALLEHAQSEAMITGKPIAWSAQPGKYQFWNRGKEGKWDQPSGDEILRERTFPIAIEWGEIKVAGNTIKLDERLVFLAGGLNSPFEMKIKYGDRQLNIRGTATGQVTVDDKA